MIIFFLQTLKLLKLKKNSNIKIKVNYLFFYKYYKIILNNTAWDALLMEAQCSGCGEQQNCSRLCHFLYI